MYYKCTICGHETHYRRCMRNHLNEEHRTDDLSLLRDIDFDPKATTEKLLQEAKVKKSSAEKVKCSKCGKELRNRDAAILHFRSAHGKILHECGICKCVYKAKVTTRKHIEQVHGIEVNVESAIIRRSEESENGKVIVIDGNEVGFLRGHDEGQDRLIEREQSYVCVECGGNGNGFKIYAEFYDHFDEFHGKAKKGENRVKCKICGKEFAKNASLYSHFNTSHRKTGVFECKICPFKSSYRKSVNRHLKKDHGKKTGAGLISFNKFEVKMAKRNKNACKVSKTFVEKLNEKLAKKMKLKFEKVGGDDLDLDLYRCTVCPKVYRSPRVADRHFRVSHFGRRYQCNKCEASYKTLAPVKAHISKAHDDPDLSQYTILRSKSMEDVEVVEDDEGANVEVKDEDEMYDVEVFAKDENDNDEVILGVEQDFNRLDNYQDIDFNRLQNDDNDDDDDVNYEDYEVSSGILTCPGCGFVSTTERKMTFHFQTRHLKYRFECLECFFAAETKPNLNQHLAQSHSNVYKMAKESTKEIKCWLCSHKADSKEVMKGHLKKVHAQTLGLQLAN